MELYAERGFEQTTVAEIAKRAGLTERTFFRYFADKREVLFAGSSHLEDLLVRAIAEAPESAAPIDATIAALEAADEIFHERREHARRRQAVIRSNADLRERELIKLASLASAITGALCERGVPGLTARLTAEAGIAVFRVAFERWADGTDEKDLPQLIRESLDELRTLTTPRP